MERLARRRVARHSRTRGPVCWSCGCDAGPAAHGSLACGDGLARSSPGGVPPPDRLAVPLGAGQCSALVVSIGKARPWRGGGHCSQNRRRFRWREPYRV